MAITSAVRENRWSRWPSSCSSGAFSSDMRNPRVRCRAPPSSEGSSRRSASPRTSVVCCPFPDLLLFVRLRKAFCFNAAQRAHSLLLSEYGTGGGQPSGSHLHRRYSMTSWNCFLCRGTTLRELPVAKNGYPVTGFRHPSMSE